MKNIKVEKLFGSTERFKPQFFRASLGYKSKKSGEDVSIILHYSLTLPSSTNPLIYLTIHSFRDSTRKGIKDDT